MRHSVLRNRRGGYSSLPGVKASEHSPNVADSNRCRPPPALRLRPRRRAIAKHSAGRSSGRRHDSPRGRPKMTISGTHSAETLDPEALSAAAATHTAMATRPTAALAMGASRRARSGRCHRGPWLERRGAWARRDERMPASGLHRPRTPDPRLCTRGAGVDRNCRGFLRHIRRMPLSLTWTRPPFDVARTAFKACLAFPDGEAEPFCPSAPEHGQVGPSSPTLSCSIPQTHDPTELEPTSLWYARTTCFIFRTGALASPASDLSHSTRCRLHAASG